VAQIGCQERQPFLRIDAGAIPREDAVHDHRVSQVMNARPGQGVRAGSSHCPLRSIWCAA
jgi:hypothetical protein